MRFIQRGSCFFLACLLLAQMPKLNIVIVEGEGAINNIRQRVVREPIVQVEDENRKPVAGAVVTFFLPGQGASGTFANGTNTLTAVTDAQGRAVATGFRPNTVAGNYQMRVTASKEGQTATTVINQANVAAAAAAAGAAGISGKLIAILAVVGGAAIAGGVIAATRGGGSSPTTTTPGTATTIFTPGTPSVGGPR
jgi:hypothetical protein